MEVRERRVQEREDEKEYGKLTWRVREEWRRRWRVNGGVWRIQMSKRWDLEWRGRGDKCPMSRQEQCAVS